MAKKPSKKDQPTVETKNLIDSLAFCSVAQKDVGTPNDTHVIMQNKTALTFNGVIAVGTHTDFGDLKSCPHTLKLLAALKKCKQQYSITQTNPNQIVVRSGQFRAIVPCLTIDDLFSTWPDNPVVGANDKIKEGFTLLNPLLSENAQHVVTSSLLLKSGSMMATDRMLIAEFWHGLSGLPDTVLPKVAITAVSKAAKELVSIGYGESSVTFWFADNSWIKTQTHSDPWPKTDHFFEKTPTLKELPAKLVEAVDSVAPFSEDGFVYLSHECVSSHKNDELGASHDVPMLTFSGLAPIFGLKRLQLAMSISTHVDFDIDENYSYFQGDGVRTIVSKTKV